MGETGSSLTNRRSADRRDQGVAWKTSLTPQISAALMVQYFTRHGGDRYRAASQHQKFPLPPARVSAATLFQITSLPCRSDKNTQEKESLRIQREKRKNTKTPFQTPPAASTMQHSIVLGTPHPTPNPGPRIPPTASRQSLGAATTTHPTKTSDTHTVERQPQARTDLSSKYEHETRAKTRSVPACPLASLPPSYPSYTNLVPRLGVVPQHLALRPQRHGHRRFPLTRKRDELAFSLLVESNCTKHRKRRTSAERNPLQRMFRNKAK